MTQDASQDFYHFVEQKMIVYHMILIPPTQILVGSSVEIILQILLNFNKTPMEIHKRLSKENNIPWEVCLLVEDQDKILLLYYQQANISTTTRFKPLNLKELGRDYKPVTYPGTNVEDLKEPSPITGPSGSEKKHNGMMSWKQRHT